MQDSLDLGYIFFLCHSQKSVRAEKIFLFLQMCIDKYFCLFVTVRPTLIITPLPLTATENGIF